MRAIQVPGAPKFPLPFSHAVRAGDFVYVSGQVGVIPETLEIAGETIEEQVKQTFRNIETILAHEGLTLDHVVKVQAYITDPADLPAYNRVYEEIIRKPYPARTTVTSDMGKYKIEIDVVAYTKSVRQE
jgi:2-iminobutanoate/2-iminopropanoate deaminase